MPHDPAAKTSQNSNSLSLFTSHELGIEEQSGEKALNLLALSLVPGLGRGSLAALYDAFPRLQNVWTTEGKILASHLKKAGNRRASSVAEGIRSRQKHLISAAAALMTDLEAEGTQLLVQGDEKFPKRLIGHKIAPRWLFVQGNVRVISRTSIVAVVGTRIPNEEGIRNARLLTQLLVGWGFTVLSGFAQGIDAVAHRTTVDLGGETIAVLGHGLKGGPPNFDAVLKQRVIENNGALVTEYFPSERYSKDTFVHRNRIQAGMSAVVFPIQSREKSGTAHTIRFAEELGREVFGVVHGTPSSAEQNEIIPLLRQRHRVFDLSAESDKAALLDALRPFAGDVTPRSIDPEKLRFQAYESTLRALWAVMKRRTESTADVEWLADRIRQFARRLEENRGNQGGSL